MSDARQPRPTRLTADELARRCGVPEAFVARLVRHGILEPETEGYRAEVTLRVQRVVRLRRDLGVNLPGAAVILDLLRRIEELERRLER